MNYYEVVFRDILIALAFKVLFISDDGWRNMRLEQNQDKGSFDVSSDKLESMVSLQSDKKWIWKIAQLRFVEPDFSLDEWDTLCCYWK